MGDIVDEHHKFYSFTRKPQLPCQPNHLMKASPIQNAVSFSYENIFGILKSSQQIWVKSDAKDVNRLDSIQAKSFGGMRKL